MKKIVINVGCCKDTECDLPTRKNSKWYNGTGVPATTLGKKGDYYLDNTSPHNYYEKTDAVTWTLRGKFEFAPPAGNGSASALVGKLIGADLSRMRVLYKNKNTPGTPFAGTFTDSTSGAVGTIIPDSEIDNGDGTGSFVVGDLDFTAGAVAYDDNIGDGTITAQANGLTFADQAIALSGGTKFVITDVLLTNAKTKVNDANVNPMNVTGGVICAATGRIGNLIFLTEIGTEKMQMLLDTNAVLNNTSAVGQYPGQQPPTFSGGVVGTTTYLSFSTPQGLPATVDVYIFGFVLE